MLREFVCPLENSCCWVIFSSDHSLSNIIFSLLTVHLQTRTNSSVAKYEMFHFCKKRCTISRCLITDEESVCESVQIIRLLVITNYMVFMLYLGRKRHQYIMSDINWEKKNKQKKNKENYCFQYFYGLIGSHWRFNFSHILHN